MRTKIIFALKDLGIRPNILGFEYLLEALTVISEDPSALHKVCAKIYAAVAVRQNTTPARAERSMRHAIQTAKPSEAYKELFGNKIPNNGEFLSSVWYFIKWEDIK